MPFRGWFALGGEEFANSSRLISHISPAAPVSDDQVTAAMACSCDLDIPYTDSWEGLQTELADPDYVLPNAPWFDASRPESSEFAGVWVMDVEGMDTVPLEREVLESVCAGGVANRSRDTTREFTFSALVVACSNAGARYGLNWLTCVLRGSTVRGGSQLEFYRAHPQHTSQPAVDLRRAMFGVVLTGAPSVVEVAGLGGSQRHRQASIFRVEWTMVATNPYMFGSPDASPVVWDSITQDPITWAHAPNCEDSTSCALPTIFNADCVPPNVALVPAAVPTCGGCLPLCSVEVRKWELPSSLGVCEDVTVSMRITNNQATPLTVNLYWQPCGSTEACEREAKALISGLPAGMTVITDSVTGRPYIDNNGARQRQVGIVTTPTGAPWTPARLDSLTCWELVAETEPGADFSVIVERRDRDV